MWQDHDAFPLFPEDFIPCPLSEWDLNDYYSLSHQGPTSFYCKQERAMESFYLNPPLTKALPTSTSKRAKASMNPLSPETIIMRRRTLGEFVGFCAKWLNLTPTMELVLDPQLVAKYMGFHVAKGTSLSTMKRIATNLHQAIAFIASPHCRKLLPPIGETKMGAIMNWYTNLNGKIFASITTHYKAKEKGITLWSVWQASLNKWQAFQDKLKVWGVWVGC